MENDHPKEPSITVAARGLTRMLPGNACAKTTDAKTTGQSRALHQRPAVRYAQMRGRGPWLRQLPQRASGA